MAHDNDNAMTRDYVEHAETLLFQFFKDCKFSSPTLIGLYSVETSGCLE